MRPVAILTPVLAIGCAHAPAIAGKSYLDPGGCRIEQVTDAGADDGHFQFHGPSHDERFMVVGTYRGSAKGAYLFDFKTGERRPLADVTNAGPISPDGKKALVANDTADARTDIIEVDLASGAVQRIASDPAPEFLATYSPDGTSILFNSYRSGRSDIYLVDRRSGALSRLTEFEGYDAQGDFAPDGKSIAFHRETAPGDYDILRLDLATRAETAVVSGPGEQAYPAWAPDGRRIAYAADNGEAGKTDIYVADMDGANIRRLTNLAAYVAYPAWSRDGARLYFNYERDGKRNVWRMRLDGKGRCRS